MNSRSFPVLGSLMAVGLLLACEGQPHPTVPLVPPPLEAKPVCPGPHPSCGGDGGSGDPTTVDLSGGMTADDEAVVVDTDNKNKLAVAVDVGLNDSHVEIEFTIYSYDPQEGKFYKCFHTDGAMVEGLIYNAGGALDIGIQNKESTEVVSPKNFEFHIGVMPEGLAQDLKRAISISDKYAKAWGIDEGK